MPIFGTRGVWQGQERLADSARRAIYATEAEGAARGMHQATPDMLLLALLDDPDGVPAQVLRANGVTLDAVRAAIEATAPLQRAVDAEQRVPLGDAARESVVLGVNEARRSGFEQAGAGHLLLGVLEERSARGARVIAHAGVQIPDLRELVNTLEQSQSDLGAALFGRAFLALLDRVGGARSCPNCGAALHRSFNYCYACGAVLQPETAE